MKSSRASHRRAVLSLAATVLTFLCVTALHAENPTRDSLPPDTPPPGKIVYADSPAPISLPFEIYRGDIRFDCKVNGHPVKMLLDDGYLWDELLFWGGPVCDSLGLVYTGTLDVGGGNEDNVGAARTASGIVVSFPGVELWDHDAVVMPPSSGASTSWSGSAGQISAGLLKNFIVHFDFDTMIMTLLPRENYIYGGNGLAVPWTPMGPGPRSIPITMTLPDQREVTLNVFMDLGYNDQLQIISAGPHHLGLPTQRFPASLGFNIRGEETRGFVGRLPKATIGPFEIPQVISSYISEEQSDMAVSEVMIGLGLLSRFNLTFDFYGRTIYFEPNQSFNRPFEYDMTGFRLARQPDGTRAVDYIHPGSPAERAGIEIGDQVLSINGKPYDYFELKTLLRTEGETITLKINRHGETKTIELTLTRVI